MHAPGRRGVRPPASSVCAKAAFDAVVFDMDGVVTRTALVHAEAWKQAFDEFLRGHPGPGDAGHPEFDRERDYLAHVDGRPRLEGVSAFLRSRGISLPEGAPDDGPGAWTVNGLGNRKNELFRAAVAAGGVEVYPSTIDLIQALRAEGVRIGLATSSRNASEVLDAAGVAGLFASVVDGAAAARLGLAGKPAPDIFVRAAAELGAAAAATVVIEDAVSGVRAARAGGFALTVGIARDGGVRRLREAGADVVVSDLAEISPGEMGRLVRARRLSSGDNPLPHG